jgi:magnesium-transporting ATPase (P-type)
MRVLDETYFNNWQESYENSKLDMIKLGLGKFKIELHKENIQDKLLNELESELFLLGATALEDKL